MNRQMQSYIRGLLDHDHKDLFMECLRLRELEIGQENRSADSEVFKYQKSITVEEFSDKEGCFDSIEHDVWLATIRSKTGDPSILAVLSSLPTQLGLFTLSMVRRVAAGECDGVQHCVLRVWVVPVSED